MINNELLRRICTIFDFNDEKTRAVFSLSTDTSTNTSTNTSTTTISPERLASVYLAKNDPDYTDLTDAELACFLNGLIIDQRGAKDGPAHQTEDVLTNNLIFNKIKIALALKAEDVISILESAGLSLTKYELSALFRNVNHKHYRACSDELLSTFLSGLQQRQI